MWHAFIIDDDKLAAETTYMMFPWKDLGISRIDKIYTTTGLVDKIITEKPDIVFIDIEMGEISGLDIMKSCKEKESNALFIIVSGHDNFDYAHTAVNLGAIHYLLKPIDNSDVELLCKKLRKILDKTSLLYEGSFEAVQGNPETNLWERILRYVEKNYDKKITAQDVCSEFFISLRTLYNVFMSNAGETFTEYITKLRIEKAKELLLNTSLPISAIAEKIGVNNPYYFNKMFKKRTGIAPMNYRSGDDTSENV